MIPAKISTWASAHIASLKITIKPSSICAKKSSITGAQSAHMMCATYATHIIRYNSILSKQVRNNRRNVNDNRNNRFHVILIF